MFRHRPYRSRVRFLHYLPDGRLVSVGGGAKSIWTWEPGASQAIRKLPALACILAVAVSTDGQLIAARTVSNRIPVWDEPTSMLLSQMIWHAPPASELAFLPHSRQLCLASWNGLGEFLDPTLTTVEFRRYDKKWSVNLAYHMSLAISPSGRYMVSTLSTQAGFDLEEIAYFDRQLDIRITRPTNRRPISRVRFFSSDDLVYASEKNGPAIWAWSREPWEMVTTFVGHQAPVQQMVATPDGKHLLTGSDDGIVIVWDRHTGHLLRQYDWGIGAITALAVAPDGLTWCVGGERGDLVTCDFE